MIDEDREDGYSLDAISRHYLGYGKDEGLLREAANIYGIDPKSELWKLPAHYVGQYAEIDAANLIPIFNAQQKFIDAENLKLVDDLESRLIPLVHLMRQRGVPVDIDKAERLSARWKADEDELRAKFYKEYGYHPDEWSGNKIARTCDRLDIDYPRTDKGNPSFTKTFLEHAEHQLLSS